METRTPSSVSGPGKRIGSDADTAPRADSTSVGSSGPVRCPSGPATNSPSKAPSARLARTGNAPVPGIKTSGLPSSCPPAIPARPNSDAGRAHTPPSPVLRHGSSESHRSFDCRPSKAHHEEGPGLARLKTVSTAPCRKHPMQQVPLTTVASYGKSAGSARVRVHDWVDYLCLEATHFGYLNSPRLGFATLLRNPGATLRAECNIRLQARRHHAGSLLLSRRASPFSSGAIESNLLRKATHGVYDFDDALAIATRGPFPKAEIWKRAVEAANLVICGNSILERQAREYTDRVLQIPSCVHPDQYQKKNNYSTTAPLAVWIGSPGTEHYLKTIEDPLLQAHSTIGLRLRVISAGSASLGLLDKMIERVDWTVNSFARDLQSADVGIMPLTDDPWSQGKCAYKLLQYGATGLPMIGSPVGVNQDVLLGAAGWTPRSNEEWLTSITECINESPTERRKRGATGHELIKSQYSYSAWAQVWLDAVLPPHLHT